MVALLAEVQAVKCSPAPMLWVDARAAPQAPVCIPPTLQPAMCCCLGCMFPRLVEAFI